jgi:hypothetical protein
MTDLLAVVLVVLTLAVCLGTAALWLLVWHTCHIRDALESLLGRRRHGYPPLPMDLWRNK